MARRCSICTHKQINEINRELIEGKSYRTIADHFDVSKSALIRHKKEHIPEAPANATHQAEPTGNLKAVITQRFESKTLYKRFCEVCQAQYMAEGRSGSCPVCCNTSNTFATLKT